MRTRLRAKRRAIRASDLAKMTVCEQKLVFEKRYGERLTRAQEERIRDGNRGHAQYLRQAFMVNPDVHSSKSKPWCFIATELWSEHAAETCFAGGRDAAGCSTSRPPSAPGSWDSTRPVH
jgi:hypothetical protein